MSDTYETLEFTNADAFRSWLSENCTAVDGVWLKIHKKNSELTSITHAEALDAALCFGWIDGLRKSYDQNSYLQKFTPRRARSLWSKRNREHVERLMAAGLMTEHGMKEINKAKGDGRWDAAYDAPSSMVIPESFMIELAKHPKAQEKFATLSKSARYSIGWKIQTAKMESTKISRTIKIIQELEKE